MTHWDCIEALARKGVSVHIDYDRGYGIDKRCGWSVTLDGSVVVQFAPTLQDAILAALTTGTACWLGECSESVL